MNSRLSRLGKSAARLQRAVACKASSAKFMVGGNWKCNGSVQSVTDLVDGLNSSSVPSDIDLVCAPTAIHLPLVVGKLQSPWQVSAQNCWKTSAGAYTGEVTADMLLDMGVPWVILGHSERRGIFKESSGLVGEKCAYALSQGMKVIACIGESLEQREANQLWDVLSEQLNAFKDSVQLSDWQHMVIAYEPVWAIGTGVVATPEQAQEVHAWVRGWASSNLSADAADKLRILYGGSVKGSNCQELASQPDIDGFLVGGASLDAKEFVTICHAQSRAASAA